MSYLHYWLSHAPETTEWMQTIELSKRKELVDRQLQILQFRDSQMFVSDDSVKELGMLWDELTGKNDNYLKQVFSGNVPQKVDATLGGKTLSSLGYGKGAKDLAAEIGNDVSKLQEMITEFCQSLSAGLDTVYSDISNSGTYDSFRKEVIELYRQKKGITGSSSKCNQQIIKDFLSKDGLVALNGSFDDRGKYGSSMTTLAKLILVAEALPEYGGQAYYYGYTSSQGRKRITKTSTFFNIVGKKVGSLINNVNGLLGEVTAAYGLDVATKEISKVLKTAGLDMSEVGKNIKVVGGNTVSGDSWLTYSTNAQQDAELQTDNTLPTYHVKKADTEIVLNEHGSTATIGITVKNYREPKNPDATRHYNVQSNTSFLSAFLNVFPGKEEYLYQFGAGHVWGSASEKNISKIWRDMVSMVVAGNVLTALAGLPKENVYYFVAGKNVWTIEEIVKQIQYTYAEAGDGAAVNRGMSMSIGKGAGIYSARSQLLEINQWEGTKYIPSAELSYKRSDTALPQIAQNLFNRKITFQLNVLADLINK